MNLKHMRQSMILKNMILRANMLRLIRDYFYQKDFLEVDTPIRTSTTIPESYIDCMTSDGWYLQSSPEMCMKQLLAANYSRIFQICHCFRKGERGNLHLPEFTLLEWYETHINYKKLMSQCMELIKYIVVNLELPNPLIYQGQPIDFLAPWKVITVKEAFEQFSTVSLEQSLATYQYDECMIKDIEPNIPKDTPVFLIDYPSEFGVLARVKHDNPDVSERFELYIGGIELANGFSELNDPIEQRKRFQNELSKRKALGKTDLPMPEKFLNALSYLPDAAGIALGIDRLIMILANTTHIDDVVSFVPEEFVICNRSNPMN